MVESEFDNSSLLGVAVHVDVYEESGGSFVTWPGLVQVQN